MALTPSGPASDTARPELLSINNYHYRRGGAESVFLQHGVLLEGAGWSVVPFAMQHPANLPSRWSSYFAEEIELGHRYSALRTLRNATRIVWSHDARSRLARLLDATRPTIAHAHNVYHHLSPAILPLLKDRGVPVVLTLHDLKLLCPAYLMLASDGPCERCKGGRIHNVVVHRCIKGSLAMSALAMVETAVHRALGLYRDNVDRFVVPSRFLLEKCVEWGWPRDRFTWIPNAVDLERIGPLPDDDRPGRSFLYAGRLAREKGLPVLIEAAARAGVPLVIAGDGPEASALQALASRSGGAVRFTGHLAFPELIALVRASRAAVLPSEWYENAPMSILETYALGRPVIGSALGGIPELVRDGVTGATFPAGDVDALATRLTDFASMPDERILAMGRAGRDWVEREFTTRRYLERILDLYDGLVAPGSTTARTASLARPTEMAGVR